MYKVPHLVMVQHHLELIKVEPLGGLSGGQVVEVVPGSEPEGVELPVGVEEEDGRRLLVAHPRVVALPLPHDVHVVGIASEAVRKSDGGVKFGSESYLIKSLVFLISGHS